ncbi:MAG: ABC-2 family transporter protein [Patescibacteria group bacterium]|nr:ABC-2 family transporter protein [Patescibacteria group bacterium]
MSLLTGVKYLSLTWEMTKLSILSAMEYRMSFLTQVIGMVINDIGLILVFFILFQKFPSINGWHFRDTMLLFAIQTVNFSLVMIFARGVHRLGRSITRGELDYYLAFPKNVLWHACVSRTDISAIGDFAFGIVVFFLAGNVSLEKMATFALVSFLTAWMLFNFSVVVQSVTFFVGNFEEAAEQMFHALLGFSFYPQNVFHGLLKLIMLTVLPAFFITTLPNQVVQKFDLQILLLMFIFCIFSFLLAIFIFKKGLRHYESGNLINVNM